MTAGNLATFPSPKVFNKRALAPELHHDSLSYFDALAGVIRRGQIKLLFSLKKPDNFRLVGQFANTSAITLHRIVLSTSERKQETEAATILPLAFRREKAVHADGYSTS
jgi:hypothetical protein